MSLKFHFKDTTINISQRKRLRSFIANIFQDERIIVQSVEYIFCTDSYLLNINNAFLNHDDYTDIITFNLANISEPIIGEIYISVDRIKENAGIFQTTITRELHRVIFHGALHLCGYKDKSIAQRRIMRSMEDKYLSLYFL